LDNPDTVFKATLAILETEASANASKSGTASPTQAM